MRQLSIVLPVLQRVPLLEESLVSILQNRPADCEILVVLNAPYADPYKLADEVRFIEAGRRAGWIECLNAGIAASVAPIVHVLSPGVQVNEGWTGSIQRHFKDPLVAAVSPLVLDAEAQDQFVTVGESYRVGGWARQVGQGRSLADLGPWAAEALGPSLLAGFYRKSAMLELGGFDVGLGPRGAAVDLALHLKAQGFRSVLDPQSKVYASAEARRFGGNSFGNALSAERLFLRHTRQGRWTMALAAHGWIVTGELVRSLPNPAVLLKLAGRAAGWLQFSKCREQQRRLQELAAASPVKGAGPSVVPRPHVAGFRQGVSQPARSN